MPDKQDKPSASLIPAHGGYRMLKSYQNAEIVYDATVRFCDRFVDRRSRTHDQMVQAVRSGKQNIAEGSMASGTSKKTELKLVGVARASLEELLLDYQDFLRQHHLPVWKKNDSTAEAVRRLAYASDRSYARYKAYVEDGSPEVASNTLIALSTRRIICSTNNWGSLNRNFSRTAALLRGCIIPAFRRERVEEPKARVVAKPRDLLAQKG
jgi:restriction system protein